MSKQLAIWTTIAVAFLLLAMQAMSQDKVKYCKNYETGEVIVVEAGYPCPYPTAEI